MRVKIHGELGSFDVNTSNPIDKTRILDGIVGLPEKVRSAGFRFLETILRLDNRDADYVPHPIPNIPVSVESRGTEISRFGDDTERALRVVEAVRQIERII